MHDSAGAVSLNYKERGLYRHADPLRLSWQEGEEARKDLVKVYKRSFKGRMVLSGGASLSGAMLGAFISKVGRFIDTLCIFRIHTV